MERAARIAPACSGVMARVRKSCSRVGPSRRDSIDAEAPLQGYLVEHLRRREAGGEGGAGHLRLVPTEPPLAAGPEQLHDLTGRPGVDVRGAAFADLLAQ